MPDSTFLDATELVLNMGPQHPSTHGVLRVILKLDGEKVIGTECVIGYLHRGIEKIAENRTYAQFAPYVDRMDYVAAVSNGLGYCLAVEKLLGVEVPPRAQAVRVILTELNRIASHLIWLGTHALDVGAITPLFYCMREREEILNIFEKYCGARLTTHAFRIGGLQYETYDTFEQDVRAFCDMFLPKVDEYEELLTGNRIWIGRLRNVGILTAEECKAYGVTGPLLRAAGVKWDLRKAQPYSGYEQYDFEIPTGTIGARVRPVSGANPGDAAIGPDHPAGVRRAAGWSHYGQGSQGDQAAGGRSLRFHRSSQRRAGLLHRQRRLDAAVSGARAAAVLVNLQALDKMCRGAWWRTWSWSSGP
jgi:NADH-quinone oxidoreductase subunit D